MKTIFARKASAGLVAGLLATTALHAQDVEVMHMWSAGDASQEALTLLADRFNEMGGTWSDSPVSGGTSAQLAALRARVLANNAPTVAQLKGPMIGEWAARGTLASVEEIAAEQNWDEVIPTTLQPIMQFEGEYVAVPLNIHRINWVYYNPTVLADLGFDEYPSNWDEFNAAMEAAQEAGIIPVVHGKRPWQDLTLYESVLIGFGGVDLFNRAFVELDPEALGGEEMVAVFGQLRYMEEMMDDGVDGRHWTDNAELVGNGEGLFNFMGDWVLGHFWGQGYELGVDYACEGTPQNDGIESYTLNADSFAFFNQANDDRVEGQKIVASMALDDDFQRQFNQSKGSIPASTRVSLDGFSPCQMASAADLQTAMDEGGLVPSFAHGMAQPEAFVSPVTALVSEFMASDMTSEDAAQRLVEVIDQARM